ncbi:MAG: type III pantothenate kinase [Verrucomicrobiota bacterium]|nr:type III pantothenate kinase [Limisphaera sp.]MDW8383020.1 type III pantothenate kinase [Verrucomicrobiota bacterium]
MLLLIDIGNTRTHVGLADIQRVHARESLPTRQWAEGAAADQLRSWVGTTHLEGAVVASVVPHVTGQVQLALQRHWGIDPLQLHAGTVRGLVIDYPRPETIGADRLANAIAARHHFGAPVVVVDFGTAVTFDIVDGRGCYVGGVIAPGLAAMTDYLHERTALLPRVQLRSCEQVVGRSTEEAMLAGAWYGYPGLVEAIVREIQGQLGVPHLRVVATGGDAALLAGRLRLIETVCPDLTLEGLRLTWLAHHVSGD